MKKLYAKCLVLIGICLITVYFPHETLAKEGDKVPGLHEFIFVKVVPGKRSEFLQFLESKYIPLQKQDQYVKHLKYYIEDRGLEWDLIVVITYDDYTQAGNSQRRFGEILKQNIHDKLEREEFISQFQGFVDRHHHAFYRDLPQFSK